MARKIKNGFTLIELIIVIIIVGILATIGLNQYTKFVESGRGAEARAILGDMRKLDQSFYLAKGSNSSLTNDDLNIGSASDSSKYPSTCRNANYFSYSWWVESGEMITLAANRCTSGGKEPNYNGDYGWRMRYNPVTGLTRWACRVDAAIVCESDNYTCPCPQ